jgi:4-hydroxyphenylpyruvate dioxygenase
MQIDRVHFYLEDAQKWRDWFVNVMGFQALASDRNSQTQTEIVKSGRVKFVLSSPLSKSSPVAKYLHNHPSGVVDVAFRIDDLESSIEKAIAAGAKLRQPLQQQDFARGRMKWCQITSIANLNHTLVQRIGNPPLLPEISSLEKPELTTTENFFTDIDHLVLNVASGELEKTVSWYERVFGFQRKQTFTIKTERSALNSQVMFHPVSGVQFPVNEPISVNSQIQEFLDFNRGAGIQHIALKTKRIIQATQKLRATGLSFLPVPQSYYQKLRQDCKLLPLNNRQWQEIIEQRILVDWQIHENPNNQRSNLQPILLQIFTKPIFNQPTFFFELIERRERATGFGEGNFQALFEAIEREQFKRDNFQFINNVDRGSID